MNYCNFCGKYDDVTTITLPAKYQSSKQDPIVVDLCELCSKHLTEEQEA